VPPPDRLCLLLLLVVVGTHDLSPRKAARAESGKSELRVETACPEEAVLPFGPSNGDVESERRESRRW